MADDPASAVTMKADGVDAELRGATVERAGQTVTVRPPPTH